MCNSPSPPPPPPPPAPAPAPPTPAASVRQGSPGETRREDQDEAMIRSRRQGRNALRIDMNVPGRNQTGTNLSRG